MPALSWFQKLRSRTKKKKKKKQGPSCGAQDGAAARTSVSSASQSKAPSVACAVSPNRASYYFPSADRAPRQDRLLCAAAGAEEALLDVRVDVVHRRAGEEGPRRRRLGGLDAPPGTPELKLRPIVVARRDGAASDDALSVSSATTSAATTPSTRARGFHVKTPSFRTPHHHHHRRRRPRLDHDGGGARKDQEKSVADESSSQRTQQHQDGGTRRRRWLYESLVVVKASSDPEAELEESMAEMVLANSIRSSEDLEELLACYLALNAAEHHRAVVAAFRRVWVRLARHVVVADQPASHPN